MTVNSPFRTPIGEGVPSPRAPRLLAGRGTYTDDVAPARTAHVAYCRSPYAHARIVAIDTAAAEAAPGVLCVDTGAEMAGHCRSWRGTHDLFPTLVAAEQPPLAVDRACWHGEPVVAVVGGKHGLTSRRGSGVDSTASDESSAQPVPIVRSPRQRS